MIREHIYTTETGTRYSVEFISSYMNQSDYGIAKIGDRHFDGWKPRIKVDNATGDIKSTPHDYPTEDAINAYQHYKREEHSAFLEWCRARNFDPATV